MSPMKRASTVDGMKRGIGTAAHPAAEPEITPASVDLPVAKPKPARVTLNLPPDLYRQLVRWTHSAEESTGVPRVGVQEAMRAMIRVITSDEAPSCSARVMAELRVEAERG